jgi:hypothetical protein
MWPGGGRDLQDRRDVQRPSSMDCRRCRVIRGTGYEATGRAAGTAEVAPGGGPRPILAMMTAGVARRGPPERCPGRGQGRLHPRSLVALRKTWPPVLARWVRRARRSGGGHPARPGGARARLDPACSAARCSDAPGSGFFQGVIRLSPVHARGRLECLGRGRRSADSGGRAPNEPRASLHVRGTWGPSGCTTSAPRWRSARTGRRRSSSRSCRRSSASTRKCGAALEAEQRRTRPASPAAGS